MSIGGGTKKVEWFTQRVKNWLARPFRKREVQIFKRTSEGIKYTGEKKNVKMAEYINRTAVSYLPGTTKATVEKAESGEEEETNTLERIKESIEKNLKVIGDVKKNIKDSKLLQKIKDAEMNLHDDIEELKNQTSATEFIRLFAENPKTLSALHYYFAGDDELRVLYETHQKLQKEPEKPPEPKERIDVELEEFK